VYRARLTTSKWRQASCSCSLTPPVLDCRSTQPKSANDGEYRRYTLLSKVDMSTSCYGVTLQSLQCLPDSVRQPNYS
jgi:hypothetical protein